MAVEAVRETRHEEIERGVIRYKPGIDHYKNKQDYVTIYKLNEMSDEAIDKYGLRDTYERYKARKRDEND